MPREKQIVRKAKAGKAIRQVAAIPFRWDAEGNIEVLLLTSRTTSRFIVPKGWPMKGKSGRKTAMIESREEAGVVGTMSPKPIGAYSYWKRLSRRFVLVDVKVYLLDVTEVLAEWKETRRRKRAWLAPADASRLIDEPELAALLENMAKAVDQ